MAHVADPARFERALALFDAANAEDPRFETDPATGQSVAKELLYGRRMSEMLGRFAPDAPEAVRLAVRAQHIQRWKSPRDSYPMDRAGYLQWRTHLYKFHADTAARLMADAGYGDDMIERVRSAVGKKGIKVNPESQMLEDVADLVFIEHYMLGFAGQKADYPEEKWLDIIRKTWKKMSEAAHQFALSGQLRLPEPLVPLITRAIAG
ncbi:MAG TPA: DUF4202 domain-containing protein [Rhodocyclaceae bacterium]|nr:DUF4202 domain-containing protein [Rhodocyclaceae bacterium]HNH35069.1 DUF4202 domain-containing protein [Rhodocyclaceae bacterium]